MTDFFVASDIPHGYPLKLQKPATASQRVRDTAETYILDSGIGDDTTTEDVLDLAHQLDADFVVPCDELHDQEATTRAVQRFWQLYPDHPCDATPLIPLQPPHADHYHDLPGHDYYCLGGMAANSVSDEQALRWIREFRQVAGPEPYVHALGIGGGHRVINTLAGKGIVDSVDAATPEMAAINGEVITKSLQRKTILIHSGEGLRDRTCPLAEINAWQIQDAWLRASTDNSQQTLSEVVS